MPRLLILTPYFPPEMGAPQARLSELGERLLDLGWQVEVLTALPNYPTGRIFAGYPRWRPVVEAAGRLRAVRVPLYPANRGFLRRLASYLSFVAAACLWGPRRCRRPDLLLVESPPLFTAFAAFYLSRCWRRPYVANVSDLWPESAVRMGLLRRRALATRLAQRLERRFYRRAAAVTGQSREIVAAVEAAAPGVASAVITNGVEPERFGPDRADDEARRLLGDEPGPIVLYAGLLGLAQGLEAVLDALDGLPDDVPGRLVLVGDGPLRETLERRLGRRGGRARLLPAQPRQRIPALLAAADVALIPLGGRLPGAVPSKIYEAMAAARPILLVAGGEAAARVEEAGCGLIVPPGDPPALRRAWQRLAADPELRARLGRAGRRRAETVYSRRAIARRLDRVLRRALGGSGRAETEAR